MSSDNIKKIEFTLAGSAGRLMTADICFVEDKQAKPVVVFAHGFKGFKDWGHFNLVAGNFAAAGFVFLKFNFSHNGTTPQQPTEFADLEAFGHNNFSKELNDLGYVLDSITTANLPIETCEFDPQRIYLIGHSRGGGIVLLKAREDARVKKIATWASVSEFGKHWSGDVMDRWQRSGVLYIANARTGVQMPLYWQAYQNYFDNKTRLFIPDAAQALQDRPMLIIHGTADEAVSYEAALDLKECNPNAVLLRLDNANHVFGAAHPWPHAELPPDSQKLVAATIRFFKNMPVD